ncbi:RlpA-like double-psi beta-barrel-protein domain-containing protein-containing protein [Mrakia frigida]|uniref:RlpA-like double-psi beta-barrel domain-containing protein n=1 Tax=Mrakia frigida TaxID=29902 RepID=UPI003FCBF743
MFASALAALLALPLIAVAAPLEARGGSRFTYYDTSVGAGACGNWNDPSAYTVALSSADLAGWGGGYPSAACGKKLNISYNGQTIEAEVQDECPTCASGQLDLSSGAFAGLGISQSEGQVYGSWSYQ